MASRLYVWTYAMYVCTCMYVCILEHWQIGYVNDILARVSSWCCSLL